MPNNRRHRDKISAVIHFARAAGVRLPGHDHERTSS
jgi:hypothetical protein